MVLLCQCENSIQDNIVLKHHLFPREVSVRAEEHNTVLLDYLQLPNICFLPLHIKTKRVVSLYKQGDYYSPEALPSPAVTVTHCGNGTVLVQA